MLMKKQFFDRSHLLLLEIMAALLTFSVVSAVCLQVFVKAHSIAEDTRILDMAVRQSGSVAVILGQTEHPMEKIQEIYPEARVYDGHASIYFDKNFQSCEEDASFFRLEIAPEPVDGQTTSYLIAVYKNDAPEEVYRLEITAYSQHIL